MGIIPILAGVLLLGNSIHQNSTGQAGGAIALIVLGAILQLAFHNPRFQSLLRDLSE